MLSRNKIYHKIEPTKDAKKVFIFCEGAKREVDYFTYFEKLSGNINIIIFSNENNQSDPESLFENATNKLSPINKTIIEPVYQQDSNDEVWFVIDTDAWGDKIENLKQNCNQKQNWFVCQSNPMFELWQYYHLHNLKPVDADIRQFQTFKEYINDRIAGGFNKDNHPPLIETAIINSESNFELEETQPKYLSTDVFRLAKVILPFIQKEIKICLKKLGHI